MKGIKEIKERIDFEKEMAIQAEKLEDKYNYPKVTSTAHYQKVAILQWVLIEEKGE